MPPFAPVGPRELKLMRSESESKCDLSLSWCCLIKCVSCLNLDLLHLLPTIDLTVTHGSLKQDTVPIDINYPHRIEDLAKIKVLKLIELNLKCMS